MDEMRSFASVPVRRESSDRTESRARTFTSSLLYGALLALVGMNLSTLTPTWDIDSAFRVGLTEAVLKKLQFGVDVVWPYGPLGFLGGPTLIHRGLLAAAVLYQFAALTTLFAMLLHLGRFGLSRVWTVVLLAAFALAISITDNIVPEVVSVTVILALVLLWQEQRPGIASPTAWWVLAISGFVAGAQVLVKFGPGVIASAVVIWFALSSSARIRNLALALTAIAAGFFLFWFGTGQSSASLAPYLHTSLELSSGYQSAQAWGPWGGKSAIIGMVTMAAALVGIVGACMWARRDRRAWLVLLPLGLATWFTLKQGLVRWDLWHVNGAFLILGLLILSVRWERPLLPLPTCILILGVMFAVAQEPARLKSTWAYRADALTVLLGSESQSLQLDASRVRLQSAFEVPAAVVAALRGGSVHAEQWDINAVWAYDLQWNPLPILQSYSTYTSDLDQINAAHYASSSGPDGILLRPDTVDTRYALWESPDARVAMTCHFVPINGNGKWSALKRAANACGEARALRSVTAREGERIDIPRPTNPESLVVARFSLPDDWLAKILTTIMRPLKYAFVTLDETPYRLVTGTAGNAHLLLSPGKVGDRFLPYGPIEHTSLLFRNVGSGTITVRFEEIPLQAQ